VCPCCFSAAKANRPMKPFPPTRRMRIGRSNNHKKTLSVPEHSPVSTTIAGKKKTCVDKTSSSYTPCRVVAAGKWLRLGLS
jgi:hypothetical protein